MDLPIDPRLDLSLASESAALRTRIAEQGSRTDHSIDGDVAGAARQELADASKSRKEEEQRWLSTANATMHEAIAEQGSRTDHSIDDESAGVARHRMAAASKLRKEEEALALATANVARSEALAKQGSRTDANIDDDAAGAARGEMAAASRQRKDQIQQELASQNEQQQAALAGTTKKIDTDTGELRQEVKRRVSRSAERRKQEAEELARANAEAAARLAAVKSKTDDGDGTTATDSKSKALAELPPLVKMSSTSFATFSRFKASEERRQQVEVCRFLRGCREEEITQHAAEWKDKGRARLDSARGRRERIRGLEQAMLSERCNLVRDQRAAAERREALRLAQHRMLQLQLPGWQC